MKKEKKTTIAEKIEIEMNKDYSFSSREIISFWQDDNFVNHLSIVRLKYHDFLHIEKNKHKHFQQRIRIEGGKKVK